MTDTPTTSEPCTDCDKVRIEKQLEAEEAVHAFERDLVKLAKQHDNELAKAAREHELALLKAEDAAVTTLQTSRWQTEGELGKLFHQTISDVSEGAIDRSRDSAKFVQASASAIATVYAGLLALVFSVTDNPLPLRGAYAALFLGLAIALATAYLAYLTKPVAPPPYPAGGSLTDLQLSRTGYLTQWVNAAVNSRRWAIRSSVIALAIGVAFIPAAFITTARPAAIPDSPTAPAISSQIAEPIAEQAVAFFEAQTASYESAVTARAAAIEKASEAAEAAVDDEATLNWIATALAVFGLLVVIGGPPALARVSG